MKLYKKLLIGALAVTSILSLAACSGGKGDANKGNTDSDGQKVVYDQTVATAAVSFSSSERHLVVGDTFLLEPKYEKISGYSMKYSSTAPEIISVDEKSGLVTALNEGSATIKATYTNGRKSASASMKISCDFGSYVPEGKLMNIVEEDGINLRVGSSFALGTAVSFNGVNFTDGTFQYSVTDSAIATVSGGKITGVKAGETSLIIRGDWRGKSILETVNVTVVESVIFYNNGEVIQDQTIYTVAEAGGKAYANTMPQKFTVNAGGNLYDDVKVSFSDSSIAKAVGATIKATAFGETKVTLTSEKANASVSFNLTVLRPDVEIDGMVELFATDYGTYLDKDSTTGARKTLKEFAQIEDELIDAYQFGKPITLDNDKVFGVQPSDPSGRSSAEVVLGTKDVLYHVHLEVVAKYFTVASDLKELQISGSGDIGGYYELLNNINASGITLTQNAENRSFTGTFEGNGHTISNLTLAEGSSMFGSLKTSVVKNFALKDLKASRANYMQNVNGQENGLTFKNIYIQLSQDTVHPKGMLSYSGSGNNMSNVVIEYTGANAESTEYTEYQDAGVLAVGISRGSNAAGTEIAAPNSACWQDVYVVSPYILAYGKYDGFARNTDRPNPQVPLYVYGANEATDVFGNDSKLMWCVKNGTEEWISLTDIAKIIKLPDTIKSDEMIFTKESFTSAYTAKYFNMQYSSVYHYASANDLADAINSKVDVNGKEIPASTTLASFDSAYWDISSGAPVWIGK